MRGKWKGSRGPFIGQRTERYRRVKGQIKEAGFAGVCFHLWLRSQHEEDDDRA